MTERKNVASALVAFARLIALFHSLPARLHAVPVRPRGKVAMSGPRVLPGDEHGTLLGPLWAGVRPTPSPLPSPEWTALRLLQSVSSPVRAEAVPVKDLGVVRVADRVFQRPGGKHSTPKASLYMSEAIGGIGLPSSLASVLVEATKVDHQRARGTATIPGLTIGSSKAHPVPVSGPAFAGRGTGGGVAKSPWPIWPTGGVGDLSGLLPDPVHKLNLHQAFGGPTASTQRQGDIAAAIQHQRPAVPWLELKRLPSVPTLDIADGPRRLLAPLPPRSAPGQAGRLPLDRAVPPPISSGANHSRAEAGPVSTMRPPNGQSLVQTAGWPGDTGPAVHLTGELLVDGRQLGKISADGLAKAASLPLSTQSRPNIRSTALYTGMRIPQ